MPSPGNCLRNVVCYCLACDRDMDIICREEDQPTCPTCGYPLDQHWWKRRARESAQWSDADAVVVFRKPDGTFSYPARNDKPTPDGCERITMRSLREVEHHERIAGVRSEVAWFDRGSGEGHDTKALPELPFRVR